MEHSLGRPYQAHQGGRHEKSVPQFVTGNALHRAPGLVLFSGLSTRHLKCPVGESGWGAKGYRARMYVHTY